MANLYWFQTLTTLCLSLTANCNHHDIQAGGHHLSLMVLAIPRQCHFPLREGLLLCQPVNQPSGHVVDLGADLGQFVQLKGIPWADRSGSLGAIEYFLKNQCTGSFGEIGC